jgi:thioredoxin 1
MSITWIIIIIVVSLLVILALWVYLRYRTFTSGSNLPQSKKLYIISSQNFKGITAKGVVLVDFWAEWCQPCKMQGPIVNQLAEENSDTRVKIGKMDVEKNQAIAQQLGIKSIPTLIVFKNGKEFERLVGLKPPKALLKSIQKAVESL